jgi:truncated hemoglobin YjbI
MKLVNKIALWLVVGAFAIITVVTSGCSLLSLPPREEAQYFRLGGEKGVKKIVNTFMLNVLTDPRTNTLFLALATDPAVLARSKELLTDFICAETEGGCEAPTTRELQETVKLQITEEQRGVLIRSFTHSVDLLELDPPEREFLFSRIDYWINASLIR